MNKELKQQTHKEFEEQFLKSVKRIEYSWEESEKTSRWQDMATELKSSIDSLIDKTVQQERDRIVGIIEAKMHTGTKGMAQYGMGYDDAICDIISLIDNKSDINEDKE